MHFIKSRRVSIVAAPMSDVGEGDRRYRRFIRAGKKLSEKFLGE
jgi:hypothetical protein